VEEETRCRKADKYSYSILSFKFISPYVEASKSVLAGNTSALEKY
jgi:hypothetical protein